MENLKKIKKVKLNLKKNISILLKNKEKLKKTKDYYNFARVLENYEIVEKIESFGENGMNKSGQYIMFVDGNYGTENVPLDRFFNNIENDRYKYLFDEKIEIVDIEETKEEFKKLNLMGNDFYGNDFQIIKLLSFLIKKSKDREDRENLLK